MHMNKYRGNGGFTTCDMLRKSSGNIKETVSIPIWDEYALKTAPRSILDSIKTARSLNEQYIDDFIYKMHLHLTEKDSSKLADYAALQMCISTPERLKSTIYNSFKNAKNLELSRSTKWFHTYVHKPILEMAIEEIGNKKKKTKKDTKMFIDQVMPFLVEEKLLAAVGVDLETRKQKLHNSIMTEFGNEVGSQVIIGINSLKKTRTIP